MQMKVAAALSTPFQLHTGWPQSWPVAGMISVFWSPHMVQVSVSYTHLDLVLRLDPGIDAVVVHGLGQLLIAEGVQVRAGKGLGGRCV